MRYLRVQWHHEHDDEPVEFLSEIDDDAFEVRKIEVFRDGTMGFADADDSCHGTRLGEHPIPPLEEIASQAEFEPEIIGRAEFERTWALARPVTHPAP